MPARLKEDLAAECKILKINNHILKTQIESLGLQFERRSREVRKMRNKMRWYGAVCFVSGVGGGFSCRCAFGWLSGC